MMQCKVTKRNSCEQSYVLNFDRALPVFPLMRFHCEPSNLLEITSPRARHAFALRTAKCNWGNTPFELPNPVRTFASLLNELTQIEGLVSLVGVHRYALSLEVAVLFRPMEVVTLVADCFRRHFYPDAELLLVTEASEAPLAERRTTTVKVSRKLSP